MREGEREREREGEGERGEDWKEEKREGRRPSQVGRPRLIQTHVHYPKQHSCIGLFGFSSLLVLAFGMANYDFSSGTGESIALYLIMNILLVGALALVSH